MTDGIVAVPASSWERAAPNPSVSRETFPDLEQRAAIAVLLERHQARKGCCECGLFFGHISGCLQGPLDVYLREVRPGVNAVLRRTMADRILACGL